MADTEETLSNQEKFDALKRVARYRSTFAAGLVVLGASSFSRFESVSSVSAITSYWVSAGDSDKSAV